MKSILCYFLLAFLVSTLDASRFRCDYTYVKAANGYLKYHEIPANWDEARLRCTLEGAVLASPLTPEIRQAMNSVANETCPKGIWTGIHSMFSRGDYASVEGVSLEDIPHTWMKCEPDNDEDSERCIVMQANGDIADASCNVTLPYVCYKEVYPGMAMGPCGFSDNSYTLEKRTGKCYKFHSFPRNWTIAHMTCKAEGGHLVIINNDVENQIVRDLFNRGPMPSNVPDLNKEITFVGFYDWDGNGEWRTIHGQTLSEAGFDKFAANQPSGKQYCGGMFKNGLLDDSHCYHRATFICEKDPESLLCDHEKRK